MQREFGHTSDKFADSGRDATQSLRQPAATMHMRGSVLILLTSVTAVMAGNFRGCDVKFSSDPVHKLLTAYPAWVVSQVPFVHGSRKHACSPASLRRAGLLAGPLRGNNPGLDKIRIYQQYGGVSAVCWPAKQIPAGCQLSRSMVASDDEGELSLEGTELSFLLDNLRIDISFAEGVDENDELQDAIWNDAFALLNSVRHF